MCITRIGKVIIVYKFNFNFIVHIILQIAVFIFDNYIIAFGENSGYAQLQAVVCKALGDVLTFYFDERLGNDGYITDFLRRLVFYIWSVKILLQPS